MRFCGLRRKNRAEDGQDEPGTNQPEGGEAVRKKNKKEKKSRFYKRFTYQQLRGWRPILSAPRAEIFFLLIGSLMVGLGVPILVASISVKEYRFRYDNVGLLGELNYTERAALVTNGNGFTYDVEFLVEEEMKAPVYVVFELGTFYQNYRRYVRSYDSNQMHDGDVFPGSSQCDPYLYEGFNENSSLAEQGAILPCGQISHSNFNDSFVLSSPTRPDLNLSIDSTSIAWKSDAEHLYGNITSVNFNQQPEYRGGNTTAFPLNQDQHWMVWQRPAGHKTTNKLYGTIFTDIPEDTRMTLTVTNRYNVYDFNGTKSFLLTTNSWVAGKNYVLPVLYLVCAGLSYVSAAFLFLLYHANIFGKKRIVGDEAHLSWNRIK